MKPFFRIIHGNFVKMFLLKEVHFEYLSALPSCSKGVGMDLSNQSVSVSSAVHS